MGMVLQNPDNQLVATIVEEDVAFGPENLGVPPEEIRRRVDDALKAVDMYEYREHAPHKLSGGQKQRVAIAGIIAMEPKCIVLDEPTAMLDPQGRTEVMETIQRLNREKGITIVLITHYMDEAVQADRVVVMDDGQYPAGRNAPGGVLPRGVVETPWSWMCPRPPSWLTGCAPRASSCRGCRWAWRNVLKCFRRYLAGEPLKRKGKQVLAIIETKDLTYRYAPAPPLKRPRWTTCPFGRTGRVCRGHRPHRLRANPP